MWCIFHFINWNQLHFLRKKFILSNGLAFVQTWIWCRNEGIDWTGDWSSIRFLFRLINRLRWFICWNRWSDRVVRRNRWPVSDNSGLLVDRFHRFVNWRGGWRAVRIDLGLGERLNRRVSGNRFVAAGNRFKRSVVEFRNVNLFVVLYRQRVVVFRLLQLISSTLYARIFRSKFFFWQLFLVKFWLWRKIRTENLLLKRW